MGLKPRMFSSTTVVKEFTDRLEPRKAFWNRYTKMKNEGSTIINFYGAGGIGKSSLLRNLQEELKNYQGHKLESVRKEFRGVKYVKYDFSIGTDVRDVLKTLKSQMVSYDCKFPMFDIGNYYYSLTLGQEISAPKQPSAFSQLPWVKTIRNKLSEAGDTADNAVNMLDTTKKIFTSTSELSEENWLNAFLDTTLSGIGDTIPLMKTVTILMSVADNLLEEYMERKGLLDENHQFIRNELNNRRQRKDPFALYEYLPALFAMDVTDWMDETGNKLIVFLDNYESLAGATNFMSTEQQKRDLWLRGDNGLIYNIPDTLWTIAGRNKLLWEGEIAEELEQHPIPALAPADANSYLKKAGISDENLRNGLVELTQCYPIFLDLCVDVYTEYKRQHRNNQPPLEEFGGKLEEVVGRIFRYIDAENDILAKDMLEVLCVLSVWTDEIAFGIGKFSVPKNFSRTTYKRVKKFTFIQSEDIQNEVLDITIFRFDKTIQGLLVSTCDKDLIADVKRAVNEYFKKFFADKKAFDTQNIFYLKWWTEFIVRFADNDDNLLAQYKDLLSQHILTLTNNAYFDAVEGVLMLFMNALENRDGTDTVPYTHFEMDLGRLRRAQGKYDESHKLTESAYETRKNILGAENLDTVEAKQRLAISLNDLGQYSEAVELHRQVLEFRKNYFGEENLNTVEAMHNLATSLSELGQYSEAFKLQEKVVDLRKRFLGEEHHDTIDAMNNLAITLSFLNKHDESLELRKKVLSLYERTLGEKHPHTLIAMHSLAASLSELGQYSEALKLQEKVLDLRKNFLGEEHPDTIDAMNNLAITLNFLNKRDEALELRKKVLNLYEEILGEKHPHTLIAMHNLATSYISLKRYNEALELQEKVLSFSKRFFNDNNPNIIVTMSDLAKSLRIFRRYEESMELQKQVLKWYEKTFGEEDYRTIDAMNNLVISLNILKSYDEAAILQKRIFELRKRKLGEEDAVTLNDADTLAYMLSKTGRDQEAIALQRDTLAKCEKVFDAVNPLTITVTTNLAELLLKSGEREEALQLVERAVAAAKQAFGNEHLKTQKILELREKILQA